MPLLKRVKLGLVGRGLAAANDNFGVAYTLPAGGRLLWAVASAGKQGGTARYRVVVRVDSQNDFLANFNAVSLNDQSPWQGPGQIVHDFLVFISPNASFQVPAKVPLSWKVNPGAVVTIEATPCADTTSDALSSNDVSLVLIGEDFGADSVYQAVS